MNFTKRSLFLIVTLLTPVVVLGQARTENEEHNKTKEPLVDARKIFEHRKQTIAASLAVLKSKDTDKKYDGDFYNAIISLGYIRAVEGIEPLAANLSFLPDTGGRQISVSPFETEVYYPSATALVTIGEPPKTSLQMRRKIAISDSKLDWALASWVLMKLHDQNIASQLLKEYAKTASDVDKPHFTWAINYVETYQVTYGDPRGITTSGSMKEVLNGK